MDPRVRLVRTVGRSVTDRRVLNAVAEIDRALFVDADDLDIAYLDRPLGIGSGQTISQPTMVALMLEALQLTGVERVLEIGAGSGYQAAILSRLCRLVVTTEVRPELAERARRALAHAGIDHVTVLQTTELGAPELGPYDAIIVAAAAPSIPEPLVDQLHVGGRLAIPVGSIDSQELVVARRTEEGLEVTRLGGCRFVPLVGEHGFGGDE